VSRDHELVLQNLAGIEMSTTFDVNERVLCYHGPLIYEAKILEVAIWDETTTKVDSIGPHFHVHYKGWKQT
jgi:mortality factor 4-like protein 1